MNKKNTLLSLIIMGTLSLFVSAPCFAVDRNDLNAEFFTRFNDDYLFQYINEAIDNNHNAKQATIRVEEYRQGVKSQFANELPSLSVAANYLGLHVPEITPAFNNIRKNSFVLPFVVNYEADFLLKNRDKTKSAKKSFEMSKFDEQSVYLALLSDVATVYTNILEYDKLIEEQEKIVANYIQILNDDNKKLSRGVINTTELNNSTSKLEDANITLENLLKQREILLMQFAVLIGRNSEGYNNIARGSINNFEYSAVIPGEIESDVIFSRPDVIAGATQDIFAGGRKIANFKFQKAKYEELFEQYRQTDLEAVKEVNTSLCIIKHDREVENGVNEKLKFNSENRYITKDMDLTKAKTQRLVNYYTLYKTVGGKI